MAGFGTRIEGLNSVLRRLRAMGLSLDDIRPAFTSIANQGAQLAKGFSPVQTGRLSGSVRPNTAANKAVIFAGGAAVVYAGPTNYG